MAGLFSDKLDRARIHNLKWNAEIERTGNPDILCFGTADMDFRSPQPILDAIHEVADIGHLGYPLVKKSYYDSIIAWSKRHGKWDIQQEWISDNLGIWPASWTVIDALTEPGDEIIFQTPVHFCFGSVTQESGRIPVVNPLIEQDGRFKMDFEGLERCFTSKTKLFWLCNPHNPVGRAWDKEELTRLNDICLRHNVRIISDDVYCGLVYPGVTYTPISTLSKEASMNTVICYSTSKTYNTTGDKHSFVVCENPKILQAYNNSLKKLNLNYGKNIFGLAITEAAYNHCDAWVSELMEYVKENYAIVEDAVKASMPLVKLAKANATYFAWLDFRSLNLSRERLTEFFEKDAGVSVEIGYKFGEAGDGFMRINMGCSHDLLKEGMDRIVRAYQNSSK